MANAMVEGVCGGAQCLHVKLAGRLRIRKALLMDEPLMYARAADGEDEGLPSNFFVRPPLEDPGAPTAHHRPGWLWFPKVSEDPEYAESQVLADGCRMLFFRLPVEHHPVERERFLIHERWDLQPMLSFLKRIVCNWPEVVRANDLHSVAVFSLLHFYFTEANDANSKLPPLKAAAREGSCTHCDAPAATQQCVCGALFCGRTCQRIAWPAHRRACLPLWRA